MGVTVQQRKIDLGSAYADAMPILPCSKKPVHDDAASPDADYKPSSKICRRFARGYLCKRASMEGGCPDVHDLFLRKEAMTNLCLAKASKTDQRKLSSAKQREEKSRKKLQGQSDMVSRKLELLPGEAGPPDTKLPIANVRGTLNKRNQSDSGQPRLTIRLASGNEKSSKSVKPASNETTPPIADGTISRLRERSKKTSPKLNSVDSNDPQCPRGDLVSRSVVLQLDSVEGPNSFCQYFLRPTGCKFGKKCHLVHDLALRLAYRKTRESEKVSAQEETRFTAPIGSNCKPSGVKHHDAESLDKSPADARLMPKLKDNEGIKKRGQVQAVTRKEIKSAKTYSQVAAARLRNNEAIKTGSQVAAANHKENLQGTLSGVKVKEKWDNVELTEWAVRNIPSNQVKKHLIHHLNAGNNPVDILNRRPEKLKEKSVFHYFGQLPGEIRNQIWDRILDAEAYDQRLTYRHEFTKDGFTYPARLLPQSITPRLLHVNMESRSRAKLRYNWVFASESYGSTVWFNFEKDTLLLHTANSSELALMLKLLMKTDRNRTLRLKIPLRDYLLNCREVLSLIAKFKNLQRLKLMIGDSIEDRPWGTDGGLVASAQAAVRVPWKQSHPNRRTPVVSMDVVDAFRAHVMGIDGLKWY